MEELNDIDVDEKANNIDEKVPTRPVVWFIVFLLGVIFMLFGAWLKLSIIESRRLWGEVMFGIGISCGSAFIFRMVKDSLESRSANKWKKSHIKVAATNRHAFAKGYKKENAKIRQSLKLMSLSANQAIKELTNGGDLYKALRRYPAKIQILILDPSSEAANLQAQFDNSKDPVSAKNAMLTKFKELHLACDVLRKKFNDPQNQICEGASLDQNDVASSNAYSIYQG